MRQRRWVMRICLSFATVSSRLGSDDVKCMTSSMSRNDKGIINRILSWFCYWDYEGVLILEIPAMLEIIFDGLINPSFYHTSALISERIRFIERNCRERSKTEDTALVRTTLCREHQRQWRREHYDQRVSQMVGTNSNQSSACHFETLIMSLGMINTSRNGFSLS